MRKQNTEQEGWVKRHVEHTLESWVRGRIPKAIKGLLEQEMASFLGRSKS